MPAGTASPYQREPRDLRKRQRQREKLGPARQYPCHEAGYGEEEVKALIESGASEVEHQEETLVEPAKKKGMYCDV